MFKLKFESGTFIPEGAAKIRRKFNSK